MIRKLRSFVNLHPRHDFRALHDVRRHDVLRQVGPVVYGAAEKRVLELTGSGEQNFPSDVPGRYVFAHSQKDVKVSARLYPKSGGVGEQFAEVGEEIIGRFSAVGLVLRHAKSQLLPETTSHLSERIREGW